MKMEKQPTSCISQDTIIREQSPDQISRLVGFLERIGVSDTIPVDYDVKNYFLNMIRGILVEVIHVESGHVSFLLRVKPVVTNVYGGLHGGALASVAEMVAVDCARTVVGKEKELFLGELSNSYLSAAPRDSEVVVDASVVRSGRNLTVVAVEFKMKDSGKLIMGQLLTFIVTYCKGSDSDTSDLYLHYRFLETKSTNSILQGAIMQEVSPEIISQLDSSLRRIGVADTIPVDYDVKDYFSNIIRGLLVEVIHVKRGRISFVLCVKPVVTNLYGGFHGGALASVAEMIAADCARTVVGKAKELFLGELSNSYLSSAPLNTEFVANASVVRSGRNLTVVAGEFKMKESYKLVYTSRATFYNMPVASL